MHRIRVLALLSWVPVTSVLTAQDARAPQPLALIHVTIIDVRDGTLHRDQTVVIRENRISAVGATGSAVPDGARVIDARGRYLMPGLWDMHVHTPSDTETRTLTFPLLIANGITGVRLMWGGPYHLAIADEAKRRGIPFAGHVSLTISAAEASDSGQRSEIGSGGNASTLSAVSGAR